STSPGPSFRMLRSATGMTSTISSVGSSGFGSSGHAGSSGSSMVGSGSAGSHAVVTDAVFTIKAPSSGARTVTDTRTSSPAGTLPRSQVTVWASGSYTPPSVADTKVSASGSTSV